MSINLPQEKLAELETHIFQRRKIEAIKLYRDLTDVGLKEAKDAVEELESVLLRDSPGKFAAPRQNKGCLGAAVMLCLVAVAVVYWVA